jgi:TDG/mug DNA glycosylase family protein
MAAPEVVPATPGMAEDDILPDVLRPGLALVFCGSAAGHLSARRGAYYAHPGNLFWAVLHQVGLTPRRLASEEFALLPEFGIGLTDLGKRHFGNDRDLPADAYDRARLCRTIQTMQPRLLAFTSKTPARHVLGRAVAFGPQPERIGATEIFVLPSPSGRARRFWDEAPWRALAARVRELSCG